MWGKKKPDTPQPARPEAKNVQTNRPPKPPTALLEGLTGTSKDAMLSTEATARLGPSLHIKGQISGNEDLLIDGSVEGLVQLEERKVTIGTAAKVTADIIASAVVVYGNVKGNVRAKDRIEIKKDGSVTGDLTTPQMIIEDGAYFKGSIEIERSTEKEAEKNASVRTASAGPGNSI